jgi:hypothetical protein
MSGSSDRGSIHALTGSRPLSPSDFAFYGFGELRRDELRKILRLGIRDDEPTVSRVENAIYVPHGFQESGGQSRFAGGIVKPDGLPIETAQMHRKGGKRFGGHEAIAVTPQADIDEEVIYLGLIFNHFGRVLLESLARIWYLRHTPATTRVVFNYANAAQAALAPWVVELLTLFGVPPERILTFDVPTRLRQAIVPEPLFEQFYTAHPAMIEPFHDVAAKVAGDVTPTGQPLYLSRRLLTSRQRPVIGEAELEDVLRENGFFVAYPETMTIADQIRLINQHTNVFSSLGSAAHSVLFARNQPRLHLLASRDDLPANYFLCSALAGAPTTFVDCLSSGDRANPNEERLARRTETLGSEEKRRPDVDVGPQAMPQLLDTPRVVAYLAERGFLKHRLRASLAGRDPAVRAQFDEAWLYARLRKGAAKGGILPEDFEQEVIRFAAHSWPVSIMLARHYARARDASRTEAMVNQFADLVAHESDMNRLAHFQADVASMATRITRVCGPDAAKRLAQILADRFLVGPRQADDDVDA